jgi:hypothetical protein
MRNSHKILDGTPEGETKWGCLEEDGGTVIMDVKA